MKKASIYFVLLLTSFLIYSCKDDDPTIITEEIAIEEEMQPMEMEEEEEEEEETEEGPSSESSNNITNDIVINGSSKIEGLPPTPNGAIDVDLSSASETGLPEEGFNIDFSSETEIVGAYIQFKATDASVADSYFDVDLVKNAETPELDSKFSRKRKKITKKSSNNSIDIDFTPQLETGNFCYVICVYDQAGNISNPQEVCINVNSWGGNDDLIGTWNLTRHEEISDGVTHTETIGVENCDENADNNSDDDQCYFLDYWKLTFNADGTFDSSFKEFFRDKATETEFVDFEIETIKGNWSFDMTTSELHFIVYFDQYEENGVVIETTDYKIGDGDLTKAERIVIDTNSLELIFDDGDGTIDDSYIEYYEK